ncbi:cupin-like domain-containing protein [Flagellimonas sp. HMM57]|uniref:cupin-like domain-containing protein n=1 Tax=unclassified Flagellimonas TaxID=2644544 RepID=UPI0013D03EF5|nr:MULTISPECIES: cupin-like domain-containing protein [unclassified Flagellimonas]UII76107.1 cupin-like domain-containing protein [Flagellimonas sp. HMM57]
MESTIKINKIDRCKGLSKKEFYDKYVKKSLPVVVTDKSEWTSLEKFTPEYFKSNYDHVTNTIDGKTYKLSQIIDLCMASTPENKAPYPNIYDITQHFPEYVKVIPDLQYGKSNRIFSRILPRLIASRNNQQELFFGGKGCSFPKLHIDLNWVHTQITQIIGEKEFILYPPSDTPFLYPDKTLPNYSNVNIMNPDYDAHPLFKKAKALRIRLNPGETIFIPSGWWHTTYIHDFNLTYAVDHVNSFNWNTFMDQNYQSAKKHYPNIAWTLKVYKLIMGKVFNFKEAIFN